MKGIIIILTVLGTLLPHTGNYYKYTAPESWSPVDTITDFDGNVYHTVSLKTAGSNQIWMAENLKVIHYNNGDPIPNVPDGKTWGNLKTGAYCDYENNPVNSNVYGKLYNWYAVTDTRKLCPPGWHVPSTDEWFALASSLGESVAGGKLKETGMLHWRNPNTGATNETGFTALPAGYRFEDAVFDERTFCCYFWSSTEMNELNGWARKILNHDSSIKTCCEDKRSGFSVRCIKD